jgi:hypothetical protein
VMLLLEPSPLSKRRGEIIKLFFIDGQKRLQLIV